MINARDIMEKNIISLSPDTEISKAVKILLKNHINGVPVVDTDGELVGILCQSDLIFQQKDIPIPPIFAILDSIFPLSSSKKIDEQFQKLAATKVEQAMVKNVMTVAPDTPVTEIASLMVEKHFHTIPVVEGKKLLGIIGKEDILKTLIP
ncbi:MAG: CBS domain-containing protein [Desulfobacteraceae bacterium]|nr:CBS domain-containing protein [Desulfobacteraceae bacterium]